MLWLTAFVALAAFAVLPASCNIHKTCGRVSCNERNEFRKFKFLPDISYEYEYAVDVETLFAGTSNNASKIQITSQLAIEFLSACEGTLKVVQATMMSGSNQGMKSVAAFSSAVTEKILRFSFNDGIITEICPDPSEETWILNYKRGILSAFQNSMKRFDVDHETVDADTNGNCKTMYRLDRAEGTSLIIHRIKDMTSCTDRYQHHSIIQSTPYPSYRSGTKNIPLIKSTSECYATIDHHIISKISCEEEHKFQPFSKGNTGAVTKTRQELVLKSESNPATHSDSDRTDIKKRSSLLFEHTFSSKPIVNDATLATALLQEMCKLDDTEVTLQFPETFTKFIDSARQLSFDALETLYEESKVICSSGRRYIIDALPMLGSNAAVKLMTNILMKENNKPDIKEQTASWYFSLAFLPRPDYETVSILSELINKPDVSNEAVLSVSSVIHTYCKIDSSCGENEIVKTILFYFETQLKLICQQTSKTKHELTRQLEEKAIVALKGIGTIGVRTNQLHNILEKCIDSADQNMEIRLAAVEAHRRWNCESDQNYFLEIFRNQAIDTEIRIAAYLQVMRCPNYIVINTIQHSLREEQVNQVGSFVSSHIRNILKSSNPNRIELQGLLQNSDFGKKFSDDFRKYSRNYEGSLFFDEFNLGGNFEGNLIFSPKSYIPRSAMFNLTVDLFGQSVNVFEISAYVEGFERYVEAMFGPDGPLSKDRIQEKLENFRFPRSTDKTQEKIFTDKVKELPSVIDNNFNSPKASVNMKIFGNDLKYKGYKGHSELSNALSSIRPLAAIKEFLSGKGIHYHKAALFLDVEFYVPTGSGLPLNLNAIGTSAVHLKASGSLETDVKNIDIYNMTLELKGEMKPSVSIDIVGSMKVDAYHASTGIKLKTNLYSSSAVEGHLSLQGTKHASLSFDLPKQNMDVIKVQSEIIIENNGKEEYQKGIEHGKYQEKACTWPTLDQAIGLRLCSEFYFPNVTHYDHASLLLNGPIKLGLSMTKADPTAKTFLIQFDRTSTDNSSSVKIIFETPGSKTKREITLETKSDFDSKNLTMFVKSGSDIYEARGQYKNSAFEKYLTFFVNANKMKYFDARLSLKINQLGKNSLIYSPVLYIGLNSGRIAELSGNLRWTSKKGVSQCAVHLEFQTKRLKAKLFGYINQNENSVATSLKMDYEFEKAQQETIKLEGKYKVTPGLSLKKTNLTVTLESSSYSAFNFDLSLIIFESHDKLECTMEITTGKFIRNPDHKAVLHILHTDIRGHDARKMNLLIEFRKPINDIDLKLSFSFMATDIDYSAYFLIKYGKGKEITVVLSMKYPRRLLFNVEAKMTVTTVTLAASQQMEVEIKINETNSNEYDIFFEGTWFTGDTISIKGSYNDKSTNKQMNHLVKFIVSSPNFREIILRCSFLRNDTEFALDLHADQENDKYGIILTHSVPNDNEINTNLDLRMKSISYSLNFVLNLLEYRQAIIDLHLDTFRDIHIELKGKNEPTNKVAVLDVKWDANRDPDQKFTASVEYDHPAFLNYTGNFKVSFPGRTIKGGYDFNAQDAEFDSSAFLEWSPHEKVSFGIGAVFKYDDIFLFQANTQILTPFQNWTKTSAGIGIRVEETLLTANTSVFWHDSQYIEAEIHGDYSLTGNIFKCKLSTTVASSIDNVPSISGSLIHEQDQENNAYDTRIYIKYLPDNIIDIKSSWRLDKSDVSTNLTGTVTFSTPFASYNRGILLCRFHYDSNLDMTGIAELNIDRRKYTASIKGYYRKINDNMFIFNITTPTDRENSINVRFGFIEKNRHVVAEVKSLNTSIGVEVLLSYVNMAQFDIQFHLFAPIEFLQKLTLVATLKNTEGLADFRVGWNTYLLGLFGKWHFKNFKDFEYSYKIFTPIKDFEENGVTAKLIYGNGIDFDVKCMLYKKRLGLRIFGKSKDISDDLIIARQLEKFKSISNLVTGNEDCEDCEEDEEESDEQEEDDIHWQGLVEVDTIVYPTIKGNVEIDEKDSIYTILGSLTLPDGDIEVFDEFNYMEIVHISNRLLATTPWTSAKEIHSVFRFEIDMEEGTKGGVHFDMKYNNNDKWIQSKVAVNFTNIVQDDSVKIYVAQLFILSPVENLELLNVKATCKVKENIYSANFTVETVDSKLDTFGNFQSDSGLMEVSFGFGLQSPSIKLPRFIINSIQNFTEKGKHIEFLMHLYSDKEQKYKFQCFLPNELNEIGSIELITPKLVIYLNSSNSVNNKIDIGVKRTVNFHIHFENYEITIVGSLEKNSVNIEAYLPFSKSYSKITVNGEIFETDGRNKRLNGEILIQEKPHNFIGTIHQGPAVISLQANSVPSQNDIKANLKLDIKDIPNGRKLEVEIKHGKEQINLIAEYGVAPYYQNNHFTVKIDSTFAKFKYFNINGNVKVDANGTVIVEVNGDSSFQSFNRAKLFAVYEFQANNAKLLKADFSLPHVGGKFETRWTWKLWKDMGINMTGSFETENLKKHIAADIYFKNLKKKLEHITMGLNINLNRNEWRFGLGADIKMVSYQNITFMYKLELPHPHHEVHWLNGKVFYTEDRNIIVPFLQYSTDVSKILYGFSAKVHRVEPKTDVNMKVQYGSTNDLQTYESSMTLISNKGNIDFIYSLMTPKYDEKTVTASGTYTKVKSFNIIRAKLNSPESRSIAIGDINYSDFNNLNGTFESVTPFEELPYFGVNFNASSEKIHYSRFFEFFWPNKTAILHTQYDYSDKNNLINLDGFINVELPLETNHIGNIRLNYQESHHQKNGNAVVIYNDENVLQAKYLSNTKTTAQLNETVTNITLDNNYFPLGINYVHKFDQNQHNRFITTDKKTVELFNINDPRNYNLTGSLQVKNKLNGNEITILAIHPNRTVKFQTNFEYMQQMLVRKSKLQLDEDRWISCDMKIKNETNDKFEKQKLEMTLSYPSRNFTVLSGYQLGRKLLSSDTTIIWNKDDEMKNVSAMFELNKHSAELTIRHPTFEKDVTLKGQYIKNKAYLLNLLGELDYSEDPNKKVFINAYIQNISDKSNKDYRYKIIAEHNSTSVNLNAFGHLQINPAIYSAKATKEYTGPFKPFKEVDELELTYKHKEKEIFMSKFDSLEQYYLKGKYNGRWPKYIWNGSLYIDDYINATGRSYLNIQEQIILMNVNVTSDPEVSLYVDGNIPDSRNAFLNIYRNYGKELDISDVMFYLRLNHSRLVTSKLNWRTGLEEDIVKSLKEFIEVAWTKFTSSVEKFKETTKFDLENAANDIWRDVKYTVDDFLEDIRSLDVLEEDFTSFRQFLNDSYNANDFYIQQVFLCINDWIEELSLRGHIEALPNIVHEIWHSMGESGQAIIKSFLWIVESIKNTYQKAIDFINNLLKGNSAEQLSEIFQSVAEKYENFVRDLHRSFLKHAAGLWKQFSELMVKQWDNLLKQLQPGFVTFAHYVESAAWNISKEILDFLYKRRDELIKLPYYEMFANFTKDVDQIFKDMTKHDIITNVKRYSEIIWNFIKEKYFTMVPFSKELQEIINEIINEFKELKKLNSINFILMQIDNLKERIMIVYNTLDIGTKIQTVITIIHTKITDIAQTALEAENRHREAKTKFIFDPDDGVVLLEQKLPMSWHAFNESPKFEEIPEYKMLADVQNYFTLSNVTFWTLYNEYKSILDPTNWLPPFKAHALILGSEHFITFDKKFYNFKGSCTYLLSHNFVDNDMTFAIKYNTDKINKKVEILILVEKQLVYIDVQSQRHKGSFKHLPASIGNTFIYQEGQILIIEREENFVMKCNLKYEVCSITLAGWSYGKVAGLLGTMDNEPSTDYLTSTGVLETDIDKFVQSWALNSGDCSPIKDTGENGDIPNEEIRQECEVLFKSVSSQFSSCFSVVNPSPFLDICLGSFASIPDNSGFCKVAIAYMQACEVENTPLRIPDICVKCKSVDQTEVVEGSFVKLDAESIPHSRDIVFIVEAGLCNDHIRQKRNIDLLLEALNKELSDEGLTDNRFSLVVYGGDGVMSEPRTVIIDGNEFTTAQYFPEYFDIVQPGNGSKDASKAISYASKLLFRPGVFKIFMMIPCSTCDLASMLLDYSVLHHVLLDGDISLNILMNGDITFKKGRAKGSIYGMDIGSAYTKKDVKVFQGDKALRRELRDPKSILGLCTALAWESNGTIFSAKFLESDKKDIVKKFAGVFSKRIAKSVSGNTCKKCECTADNYGISYMECFPCSYRISTHFPNYAMSLDADFNMMTPSEDYIVMYDESESGPGENDY